MKAALIALLLMAGSAAGQVQFDGTNNKMEF